MKSPHPHKIVSVNFDRRVLVALEHYIRSLILSDEQPTWFVSKSAVVNNMLARELSRLGFNPYTIGKKLIGGKPK